MTQVRVNVEIDEAQLARMEAALAEVPRGLGKAISRGINKIAITARARLLDLIVSEINVKKSDIRERNLKLRRASFDHLYAVLSVLGRRIPLTHFAARQTRKGVSYAITKGKRQTIAHAFLKRMESGHLGVMLRTGEPRAGGFGVVGARSNKVRARKAGLQAGVRPRLPISERFGPSVPEAVSNAQEFLSGTFAKLIREKLAGELDMQVKVLLEQFEKNRNVAPF